MKILFYVHLYPDEYDKNPGIFIHNQAIALKKLGHTVNVIFCDYRSIKKRRKLLRSSYLIDGIDVYRFALPLSPFHKLQLFFARIISFREYKRFIKTNGKPDIIYSHFYSAAKYAVKLDKEIPTVIMEHDSGLVGGKYKKSELNKRSNTYKSADACLVVGKALKDRIASFSSCKLYLVPNVIPDYMFGVTDKSQNKQFVFVTVANLIKRKNIDITIRAFARLAEKYNKIKYRIIGNGPEHDTLINLTHALGVDSKVNFEGAIANDQLPTLYRQCNCFVLCSSSETFGMVYAEAMANGLPVIATRCGGPEEFINQDNGVLINIDDESNLYLAMEYMVENASAYSPKLISKHIQELYSEKIVAEQLCGIFQMVIN